MTIVIPSHQRVSQLGALLDSIADALDHGRIKGVDVHVVLDGSNDGSAELVADRAATFPVSLSATCTARRGAAAARNTGVLAARGELVWLIDDDMVVDRAALRAHLDHDRNVGSVLMGPCDVRATSTDVASYEEFYDARHARLASRGEVTDPADFSVANTSAPKTLLSDHPMDERFVGYGFEDYELGVRLLDAGVMISYRTEATIAHDVRPTRSERLTKLREEGANRVRFVDLHPTAGHVAFPPAPPRLERILRGTPWRWLSTPLFMVAELLDRVSILVGSGRLRDRLRYLAEVCAVYSGVARVPGAATSLALVAQTVGRPAISFVVPARNAAATIEDTFRSLAAQTSSAWEAVIVDDGSTDETPQIIARWVANDPRLRVIEGPRRGVSAARNAGIDAVHHDWVAFLDADDRIHPSYVARLTDALVDAPQADGARCRWAYETQDGRFSTAADWDLDRGVDPFEVFAAGCSFAIHACVVRRSRLTDCGGFDTQLVVGEDWDLWQRLMREGLYLVVVPETLAFYVMRPQSVMHRDVDGALRDMLTCYRRGHSNDVRVRSPRPEYVDGAALVPGRDIVGENVLACAAVVTGMGGGPWPLPPRPPDPGLTLMPEFAADAVFAAVPFGACLLQADWPAIWVERSCEIVALIDDVASWCDQPQIVRRTQRLLEKRIVLEDTARTGSLVVGATVGTSLDLAAPIRDIEVPPATERLVVKARFGERWLGSVDVPVLGDGSSPARVEAQWIRDAVERELGLRLLKAVLRSPRSMARVGLAAGPRSLRRVVRFLLDLPVERGGGRRHLVRAFARTTASELIAEAAVLGERRALFPSGDETLAGEIGTGPIQRPFSDEYGKEYFEEVFEQDDPWFYTSSYEQTKYEQTLSLVDGAVGRALELACAEGHFTVQLAPVVGHLVAADISELALQRAAERCGYSPNIEFAQIDLREGTFPSGLDLIVCSEVLYYLPQEEDLRALGRRFADALVGGGQVVMAHANLVSDDPDSTGFDWGHRFGSRRIGELVSSAPGLYLETEIVTPLYRIQSIRKSPTPVHTPPPPTYQFLSHAQDLDPYISRMVVWGGAVMTQDVAMDSERTIHLPILMYHRVAESGPGALAPYRLSPAKLEEHLAYLRRHGYYGVTVSRWQESLAERRPLPGRAVMLTFDDAYVDFAEVAWPLLEAYGFPATIFAVADAVGGAATWDAHHGEAAPLLSWDQLRALQAAGVELGSHSGSHVPITSLSPHEAQQRELAARATFERELGRPVSALAYPYGDLDEAMRHTMARAGYTIAVTTREGLSTVWDDPLKLPRLEVSGDDDLDAFIAKLGSARPHNPIRRALHGYRRVSERARQLL